MSLSPTFARLVCDATADQPTPINVTTGLALARAIRSGLPTTAIDYVVKIGKLSPAEIDRVVIPRKTLAHRKIQGSLTADQSDRFIRVARIISLAEDTFANAAKAGTWLRRPTSALNDEKPLDLLDTEEGAREVEMLLTRIAHGIAA